MRCRLAQVAAAGPCTVRRTGWGGSPAMPSATNGTTGKVVREKLER